MGQLFSRKSLKVNHNANKTNETMNLVLENAINEINYAERYIARFISSLICQMFDMEEEMKNRIKMFALNEPEIETIIKIAKRYAAVSKIVHDLRNIENVTNSRQLYTNSWSKKIEGDIIKYKNDKLLI